VDYSSFQESSNRRPIGTFPSQVYDVKSAIRFLKANAKQYDAGAEHIGVIGESSGGNLSLLLGLTRSSDGLEGEDEYPQYSSAVQAAVSFAGPTDLINMDNTNPGPYNGYLGGTLGAQPEQYNRASSIAYVRPDEPPVLTIHGDKDNAVSINQAVLLDQKMKEVGAPHTLIIRKGGSQRLCHG
jgi:acetyl esterase/lipase